MISHDEVISEIIFSRRTIKPDQFNGEIIDEALIDKILAAANWAPTHGYTEPWRFTVFKGLGLVELGLFYANLDQPDKDADGFNSVRFERLKNRPSLCSHVIGIGMKRGENPKIPEIEEICSVAMAVQNIWLTAHSLGVAGYWSTGSLAFTDELRDFFGLGNSDRSLGLFYLGKTDEPLPVGRRISGIGNKLRRVG